MDFTVNIGRNAIQTAGAEALQTTSPAQDAAGARQAEKPNLSITQAAVAPGEIAAAGIDESSLTRDDALGRLVASAFNLPPPPMPDFAKLA